MLEVSDIVAEPRSLACTLTAVDCNTIVLSYIRQAPQPWLIPTGRTVKFVPMVQLVNVELEAMFAASGILLAVNTLPDPSYAYKPTTVLLPVVRLLKVLELDPVRYTP